MHQISNTNLVIHEDLLGYIAALTLKANTIVSIVSASVVMA